MEDLVPYKPVYHKKAYDEIINFFLPVQVIDAKESINADHDDGGKGEENHTVEHPSECVNGVGDGREIPLIMIIIIIMMIRSYTTSA